MRRRQTELGADEQGTAVLEFAILAPLLFAVLLGFIEMGRMFYVRQALEYATQEAARYYMLNPTTDSANVTAALRNAMAGGMGPTVSVAYGDTPSCNGKPTVTCTQITATLSFVPAAGYLKLATQNLTARAQAVRY